MALIDVLPKFRYKPLDLGKPVSQLAPKPDTLVAPPGTIAVPQPLVSAPVGQTLAAPPIPLTLPNGYRQMDPLVQALNDSTIVNDKAKLAVIAQMGLEKGWKTPNDFSYGNITAGKSWKGPTTQRGDHDAKGNKITQSFRSYGSPKEFVDDYLNLLKNNYPRSYRELHSSNFDIDRFTSGLVDQPAKYAEDPEYKSKVKRVYESVLTNVLGIK
jgi:hypothetical protein